MLHCIFVVSFVCVIVIVVIVIIVNFLCSNTFSSEVYGPVGFKFYVRYPGVGLYQIDGNYDFWSIIKDISDIQTVQISLSCILHDDVSLYVILQTYSPQHL